MKQFTIESSHGNLIVDEKGNVIEKQIDCKNCDGCIDMSNQEITLALHFYPILKKNTSIDKKTREDGISLLNKVIEKAPELLQEIEKINKQNNVIDLAKKLIKWNDSNKKLSDEEARFLNQISNGEREISEKVEQVIIMILDKVKKIRQENED